MTSEGFDVDDRHKVTTIDGLEALYGDIVPAAIIKEIDHVSDHYRVFIEKSPFMILATAGPGGLDCSPRGDPAGFVRIADPKTLLIPDRRGNNRIDSLRNIVSDPRAALLFLIPGIGQTLRVNGRATIVTDPELVESFAFKGKRPSSVIMFKVESVYTQCPKALVRSRLWSPDSHVDKSELPTAGEMLHALSKEVDAEEYDRAYPERLKQTIY